MRMLRETESRVDFFKRVAGRNANERENELKDNKMNIKSQNNIIRTVKNKFNRTILEKLKDKVNLAIACLIRNISNNNVSDNLNDSPHSIWLDTLGKGSLR